MQHARNKELQFEKKQQEANEEIYRLMLQQQNIINEARQSEKKRISQESHGINRRFDGVCRAEPTALG